MKKILLITTFIFLSINPLFSKDKKKEDWNIAKPEQKITNAEYSKITVQDLRVDKNDMGFVQKGAFNRYTLIQPVIPLEEQISNLFKEWVSPLPENNKELIIQIRDFYFSELTSGMSETGRFIFRATIFGGSDDQYFLLRKVDEVYNNSSIDVTLQLEREAGLLVSGIVQNAIRQQKPLNDVVYTLNDVTNFESLEKKNIPLYYATTYADGIYKDFQSFSQQKPTDKISEVKENGSTIKIYYLNEKQKKRSARGNYAAVYNGKPYINNGDEFVSLVKKGEDFYFYGYVPKKVSAGKQIGIGIATGVVTTLLTGGIGVAFIPTTENVLYEFRMDFLNGSFKPIEEVKKDKK